MKRESIENQSQDIEILSKLGYTDKEINKLLDTGRAFKAKSYPEQYLAEVLSHNFTDVKSNIRMSNDMELDIAIYDINTGIEYSGSHFHEGNEDRDKRKRDFIESKGVRLITITEYGVGKVADQRVEIIDSNNIHIYRVARNYKLENLVKAVGSLLDKELVIPENIHYKVKDRVYTAFRSQNLESQYPDLAKEYSPNNPIPANRIFISDPDSLEWICSKGHTFNTSVGHRVFNNTNCPYCAGNLAIPGETDITTVLPGYAKEIISLTEEEKRNTLPISTKPVTWRCTKCNHEWDTTIHNRTNSKTGCPKCGYIPLEMNTTDYVDIDYLTKVYKPISKILLDGEEHEVDIAEAIGLIIFTIIIDNNTPLECILDNEIFYNRKSNKMKIAYDTENFTIPKLVCTIGYKNIYIEGNSTTQSKTVILRDLIAEFDIENVRFKIKEERKMYKGVTLAKDKIHYNSCIRLNGKNTYLGRRDTPEEALKLRLSAEKYFFGEYQIVSDVAEIGEENIPRFETTEEYWKFVTIEEQKQEAEIEDIDYNF